MVTSEFHSAFLAWLGVSGSLKEPKPWQDWCSAVGRRFSAKNWTDRLGQMGIQGLPKSPAAIVDVAGRHFLARGAYAPTSQAGA